MANVTKPAYLAWTTKAGLFQDLFFDAVVSETHRFTVNVTTNPVESGADIADNARKELDRITLEVFVSNSPIVAKSLTRQNERAGGDPAGFQKMTVPEYTPPLEPTPGSIGNAVGGAVASVFGKGQKITGAQVLTFPVDFNSVSQVIQQLRQLEDTAQIVQVITPHWDYESMMITSVEMPRRVEDGDGARFTIELTEIRVVESKRTSEPVPTEVRGKAGKSKGAKGPIVVEDDRTIAAKLEDKFK